MSEIRVYVLPTTRAQREKVWQLFCRDFPSHEFAGLEYTGLNLMRRKRAYRNYRKQFHNYRDYIGGMWKGMFLGIERDGYSHT